MKEWITIFLAWFVVPLTMIAFWLRFIPRHDWVGTIFHIGLIVLSVAFAIIFYRLCALTLQGKKEPVFQLQSFWRDRRLYYGVSVALVAILFSLLSYGAINGLRRELEDSIDTKNFVPWAFEKIGYDVFANFREKSVSEKSDKYWEISENDLLKYVKGADLENRNLQNADMYKAFLVKANFRKAVLFGAYLKEANLQKADLRQANLQKANLWQANLKQANFTDANLQKAKFPIANLQQANLLRAKLQEAAFPGANLQKADFAWANLQQAYLGRAKLQQTSFFCADLRGAKNLTIDQLSKVKTLYQAKLDPKILEKVKKCCPHLLEEPKEETDKTE